MPKLKFNPETPLYTSDAKAWRIDQFDEVWSSLQASGKPLVLFVHGRGKEPGKSLLGATFVKGLAVHKIERGYDVRVLMFNWDSAFRAFAMFDRQVPLSHTAAGASALLQVLEKLQAFATAHPGARQPALLVHSMGSVVVQRAVEGGAWPQAQGIFSAVVFSQPDADDVGHAGWLDTLARREKTFVTLNRDDKVLGRSTDSRPAGARALGLGTTEPLARHATYVDISRMGPAGEKDEDHEVFGKGAMNGQVYICEFFTQALTGRPVQLDPALNVERVDGDVLVRLRDHRVPGAPCLKIPPLPASQAEDPDEALA
jgi:esterase/lipase superfamily enzyme